MTFEKKFQLSNHLSIVHYKKQLLEYVNLERLECLLSFSDLNNVLRHVGNAHGKNKEFLDENANRQTNRNHFDESSKPLEKENDEIREKTLQEDLNLSSSSIEDLIMSDDEQ